MFRYAHPTYGTVVGSASLAELTRYIRSTGSHFFDPDTMSWFGTRNLHIVGGIVIVGEDTKAPAGVDRFWARVFVDETRANGDVFASGEHIGDGERFATRKLADNAARKVADEIHAESV